LSGSRSNSIGLVEAAGRRAALLLPLLFFFAAAAWAQSDSAQPSPDLPATIVGDLPKIPGGQPSFPSVPTIVPDLPAYQVAQNPNRIDSEQNATPVQALSNVLGEVPNRSSIYTSLRYSGGYESSAAESSLNFMGSLNLLLKQKQGETILMYAGGDEFHTKGGNANSIFHRVSFSQALHTPRWNFGVSEQFDDLPASGSGTGSYGGVQTPISDLLLSMGPNLLLQPARRYSNSSMVSVERIFRPHWSLFAHGGYGFLEFPDTGFVSYRSPWGGAGIRYALRNQDVVSLDATAILTHFSGATAMRSYQLSAKYKHVFLRRYSVELSAGPEIADYIAYAARQRRATVDGRASVSRAVGRGYTSVIYKHSTDAGGGIMRGAEADDLQIAYGRAIARGWQLTLSTGWNHGSTVSTLLAPGLPTSYNSGYGGFNLERKMNRSFSWFLNYAFRYQTTDQVLLSTIRSHVAMAGFYWNPRPIAIH